MNDFLNGFGPDHVAAVGVLVVAAVLVVPAARVVRAHSTLAVPWAVRLRDGWAAAGAGDRWAAALLAAAGVIHLGLPLGHGGALITVAFLAVGVAYCWLALRAVTGSVTGRRWRGYTVALVLATLVAYLVNLARGEEADQVGLATALVELAALGLAMGTRRRVATLSVLMTASVLFGVASWVSAFAGHDTHDAGGTAAGSGDHHHGGQHLARAQAGVIMRPGATGTTAGQQRAAAELVAAVRTATAKYLDVAVALADGYRPDRRGDGLDLHFENEERADDAAVLDPSRPEQLVYARAGDRAALLGVVFRMPRADQRGPQVGGASTTWHSHNICVGGLPPGFGVVTPYGTCPFLTAEVTLPEMMHVWVVDSPAGPFADSLPKDVAERALGRV